MFSPSLKSPLPHHICHYCSPASSVYSVISRSPLVINDVSILGSGSNMRQFSLCVQVDLLRAPVAIDSFDCDWNIASEFHYNTTIPALYHEIVLFDGAHCWKHCVCVTNSPPTQDACHVGHCGNIKVCHESRLLHFRPTSHILAKAVWSEQRSCRVIGSLVSVQ